MEADAPELSRIVEVENLAPLGETVTVTADQHECALIKKRLGLVSLSELSARLTLEPWRKGGWRVTGFVHAGVEQLCVVTAQEFDSSLSFDLDRHFLHEKDRYDQAAEVVIDPLSDDEPDVIARGRIDIGELIVEGLALALDPYPRVPGAQFDTEHLQNAENADDAGETKPNPFSVLAKLQRPE